MKKIFPSIISLVLAFSLATPSVSAQEADSSSMGLLGYWKFDESSWAGDCLTADIVDSSGNNRHGIACINGDAPFPVPGKFGNAGRFDGINQYANMGAGFNFISSFTASLWMALDDYNSCGPTGKSQHIIGTHHLRTPDGNGRGWGMYWDCDGLAWELTNSTGSAIASYGYLQPSPFPTNGSWHYAALVYDSAVPSATLYWDGVPVYSESGTANVPSFLFNNGEPLTINGLPYAPSAGAPGKIDDTRIYDRALSDAEIENLFGNHSPLAVDDAYTTDEDTPLNVAAPGVLGNDTDPDGDPLTAVLDGGPDSGTLSLATDGSFTYTPNANFNGMNSFTYYANDGTMDSNVATVTITVIAVNDAPVAVDDSGSTLEDIPVNISVLANDTDVDDPNLTVSNVTQGVHGTVVNNGSDVTYTPESNWSGTDTFAYSANDGAADSNVATVTITVGAVNDAPVAIDDAYSTDEDTPINVATPGVLVNDTDPEGDPLTVVLDGGPGNGMLILKANGTFTYTPNVNFNGTDSFTYHANDGTLGSNGASVTITVNAVNDAPVAVDDTYSTDENTPLNVAAPGVLGNDTDPDGDPLTAVLDGGPDYGTLSLNANGSFTYTPNANFNGTDSLTYHANDGTEDSNVATVTITVNMVVYVPVVVNDAYTTDEDTPLNVAAPGVLGNDTDPDGDPLTAVLDGGPVSGTLSLATDGSFSYTPNANFNGEDSFTYHANDGTVDSNVATVTITVNAVNDAPVAVDDTYSTDEDTTLNVAAPGVLGNDFDPDGDPLTAVLDGGPGSGTLSLATDGSFSYTPNVNFYGADNFNYTVLDGNGGVDTVNVSVMVSSVNDPPAVSIIAPGNGFSYTEGDSITFIGTANDVEDGSLASNLAWSSNLDGSIGTGSSFPTSTLSVGTHTVTAVVTDSGALEGTDHVTITVTPAASIVDALADGEISVAGTVSGDYISTHGDDGNLESITERESSGKPKNRYSYLEHKWIINVMPGNTVTVYANAWSGGSNDGDNFIFAYSTNGFDYIEMFTVDNASNDANIETYILPPSVQGMVYLRVTDSNQSPGNLALDTVYVDNLYIRSETQPGIPPDAPSGLVATSISATRIDLTWVDNANGENGFYIERSLNGTNWSQIDAVGENVTSFSDATVSPTTLYYYRVRAYNGSGSSTYSNIASTTTLAGLSLSAQGYKVKGVQSVDLFWNGDSNTYYDVYRDGGLIDGPVLENTYIDNIGLKGGGSYKYQVCEAGSTANCSNTVQVDF